MIKKLDLGKIKLVSLLINTCKFRNKQGLHYSGVEDLIRQLIMYLIYEVHSKFKPKLFF